MLAIIFHMDLSFLHTLRMSLMKFSCQDLKIKTNMEIF